MRSRAEIEKIENLQLILSSLRSEMDRVRGDLRKLVQDRESRRCQVELYWDEERQLYITRYYRDTKTLYVGTSKKYSRCHATVGIESVDDKPPRVPWKQVEAGTAWMVEVIVTDCFWAKHIDLTDAPPCRVIYLDSFR